MTCVGTDCTKWDAQIARYGHIDVGMGTADQDFKIAPAITRNYFDRDLGIRYNLTSDSSFTFLNFWRTDLDLTRYFRGQDAQLTRGGPVMGVPLACRSDGTSTGRSGAVRVPRPSGADFPAISRMN